MLQQEHGEVFQDELGTLKGFQAKIYVDPSAQPKFCKARTVPYAMQMLVEKELDHLVQLGILEPIQFAEWAAPIVPVATQERQKECAHLWRFQAYSQPSIVSGLLSNPENRGSVGKVIR